ncbi:hypothetical protein [Rhodococcus jostii]|uniref:hypothetical protein n=1 Tax=Rhodococcus jostii TaxID=132919 RepID=UPI00362CA69B
MLTSITKRIATGLRGIADTLDPTPVRQDPAIHIEGPVAVCESLQKVRKMQARQAMSYAGRF